MQLSLDIWALPVRFVALQIVNPCFEAKEGDVILSICD